jgi:hypothetical protein
LAQSCASAIVEPAHANEHVVAFVYVGSQHRAAVDGARWQIVTCDHCSAEFAFRVEERGYGHGRSPYFLDEHGASARATSRAKQDLARRLHAAICDRPCPHCGRFQAAMVERLRARQHSHLGTIGFWLLAFAAFCGLPSLLGSVVCMVLSASAASSGVACYVYRRRLRARFDPNSDADRRAGREHEVVGGLISRVRYESLDEDQRPAIRWPLRRPLKSGA